MTFPPETRLRAAVELIETMPHGRDHTLVPCEDLKLLGKSGRALLDLLPELREMRRVLKLLEWKMIYPDTGDKSFVCPMCHKDKPNHLGKNPYEDACALAARLRWLDEILGEG